MIRPYTRKLPAHRGSFSYGRIPMDGGGVIYRLFRRDQKRVLHAVQQSFSPEMACDRCNVARAINAARHQLRDHVDDIDLKIMGVTQ